MPNFTNLFWHETTCFRQFLCPSSGVHSLYIQQWYVSYRFVDSYRAMYSEWTPGDGQRNCPKHVVSCQNKFVILVHLVGFIIKKFIMMHGHMNIKFIFILFRLLCVISVLTNYFQWSTTSSLINTADIDMCFRQVKSTYFITW